MTLELRSQLRRDGFAVVRDATNAGDVQAIRAAMVSIVADDATVVDLTLTLRPELLQSHFFRHASMISRQILGPAAKPYVDRLLIKPPHSTQASEWHQDGAHNRQLFGWIVTNSPRRLHWWLPLQPVNTNNGCMQFVAGSHRGRLLPHVPSRGGLITTLPASAVPIPCPLGVGDATVHLLKTLHYAGPNYTDAPRYAWVLQFLGEGRIPTIA